jgi:osmotically-inducible protein OsmY
LPLKQSISAETNAARISFTRNAGDIESRGRLGIFSPTFDRLNTETQEHAMDISFKKPALVISAYLAAAAFGMAGSTMRAEAAPEITRSSSAPASLQQGGDAMTGGELQRRVTAALHDDPYFPDEHVTVSVDRGAVVLHGFVFSGWDLQDALRIAQKAAGSRRVIDNLSIEEGGR